MGALKAYVAAGIVFLGTFLDEWTGAAEDPLQPRDYIVAALAGLIAFNAVYFTPNKP